MVKITLNNTKIINQMINKKYREFHAVNDLCPVCNKTPTAATRRLIHKTTNGSLSTNLSHVHFCECGEICERERERQRKKKMESVISIWRESNNER